MSNYIDYLSGQNMMEVNIKGGTVTQKKYAESITWFVCRKLMPRLMNKLVTVSYTHLTLPTKA